MRRFTLFAHMLAGLTFACCPVRSAGAEEKPKAVHEMTCRDFLGLSYEEALEILPERNAALHYLMAIALLPPIDSEQQSEIETKITGGPAAVVLEMPEHVPFLAELEKPVTAHMRRGARMERCAFDPDWSKGAGMEVPYLAKCRMLARFAVAYGKFMEANNRKSEAAEVYCDVIAMGVNMCTEPLLIQKLVGIAIQAIGGDALMGLLAGGLDAETATRTLERLNAVPEKPLDMAQAAAAEKVIFGGWLGRALVEGAEGSRKQFIEALTGIGWDPDLADNIKSLTAGGRKGIVNEMMTEYNARMEEAAIAMDAPFVEASRNLGVLDEKIARGDRIAALFFPTITRSRSVQARAEAQLRALRILAAAAAAKQGDRYPDKIDALTARFPQGLPKDPFTGSTMTYRLEDGLPTVEVAGPSPGEKADNPRLYIFSFSARLREERQQLQQWKEGHREADTVF
ncbi:MAG: hypothetical protein JW909_01755 [Planctomycetes bacterium]|nr:hypothetical protein [Planctomycetota bacterium]